MRDPTKGHAALRRGRVSIPHAEYFLTVCTDEKRPGLTSPAAAIAILTELRAMDVDGTWQLRCAVVMPDHLHALAILGERLTLGQSVGRLKSKTKSSLRTVAASLDWERDFFDHHVRPDEDRLALFLYIFLNPYRTGLCARGDRWPWYFCREEDWSWFSGLLAENRAHPEWLLCVRASEVGARLRAISGLARAYRNPSLASELLHSAAANFPLRPTPSDCSASVPPR